jgi:methionine sulfoxide reductase heme-binding subunit
MRLNGRTVVLLATVLGLIAVVATDQILPADTAWRSQMRVWLVARAAGFTSYGLLTVVVALGLVLSHPVNQSTWRLSKRLFPWHENLFVFTIAFTFVHIVGIILDPYAGVGIDGAFIPGLSTYRSVPVALGTFALYALLLTGLTARYTSLLPRGVWLKLHRFSLVVWALGWVHGILSGTDTEPLSVIYVVSGLAVLGAAAYRYWVGRQRRPTFATSLPQDGAGPLSPGALPGPVAQVAAAASAGVSSQVLPATLPDHALIPSNRPAASLGVPVTLEVRRP